MGSDPEVVGSDPRTPSLAQLERWMKSRILPGPRSPRKTPFRVLFNKQAGDPGEKRIAVYADGYLARMREALKEAYEAVDHVVGEKRFGGLARRYAEKFPSQDTNLSFAGRHFEKFLKSSPELKRWPFLADLAGFEWRLVGAFHAFQEKPLDPGELRGLSGKDLERVRIEFQPSVRLFASAWPVFDIWNARKLPPGKIDIDLKDRPQRILIYRSGAVVRCELVDPNAYGLLEALLRGHRLGKACERLARRAGTGDLSVADWFAAWARGGLLTTLRY